MTAENRKIVEQMEAAYNRHTPGETNSNSAVSNKRDKMVDPNIPEEQTVDEVAALDQEFNESLAKFDDKLLKEMDAIRAESAEKLQDLAQEAADAAKRLRDKGVDVDTSGSGNHPRRPTRKRRRRKAVGKRRQQEVRPTLKRLPGTDLAREVKVRPQMIDIEPITKMMISSPGSCGKRLKTKRIPNLRKNSGKSTRNIRRAGDMKFSFSNLASITIFLLIISGCATYQAQKVGPTTIMRAQAEIPEDQLMDVGILVFKSKEITEEEAEDEGTNNEIRKAESHFIPYHLKNTLRQSSQWGAVRVIPAETDSVDLLVTGQILESNGEDLGLQIDVTDAAGKIWFSKKYKAEATRQHIRRQSFG